MRETNPCLWEYCATCIEQKLGNIRLAWLGRLLSLPVFWVVFLSYCAFFWSTSMYYAMGDTHSYTTYYPYNIFVGETDIARTPVYPTVIRGILFFTKETIKVYPEGGKAPLDVVSGNFSVSCIIGVQMFCFAVALVFFYYASLRIIHNKTLVFWVSLFCGISLIYFQRWLSTEPLSISAVMIFYALMIFYITSPTWKNALPIGLWTLVMIMLRPVFVYLLPLLASFWVMRLIFGPKRNSAVVGLLSFALAMAGVYGYCSLNKRNHNHFALTSIGSYNQLSRIINLDFYKNGSDPEINAYIESLNPTIGEVLYPEVYQSLCQKYSPETVDKYVKSTVLKNFTPYCIACLKHMWWWGGLRFWNACYMFGIFDICLTLVLWVTLRHIPWIRLGLWGLFYCLVALIYLNTTCDYDRLISPCLPVIYVMIARTIDLTLFANKHSVKEVSEYLKETL